MVVMPLSMSHAIDRENSCFKNEVCPEGKVCADYQIPNKSELNKRLRMIQKEYRKPWKVQDWGLHWFSKLNEKIRLKYNGFSIKKSAYKETVVLKYKDGELTKKTKFYVYDKKDLKNPKNSRKKKPLLLVIPPIYDISPFDYWQAYDFADKGYKVAILDLGGMSYVSPLQPTSSINESILKTIGDANRVIEYMTSIAHVDPKNIGIFGFSLGGNIASLVFSVNPKIKVLSTVSSGAKFAELLTNSSQTVAKIYRKMRKKREGIPTDLAYLKTLKKSLLFDPIYFAHLRNPEDVYMVFSDNDSSVPTKNQRELESAFCASEELGTSRWEKGEHFPVIVKDLFKRTYINDFFDKNLLN